MQNTNLRCNWCGHKFVTEDEIQRQICDACTDSVIQGGPTEGTHPNFQNNAALESPKTKLGAESSDPQTRAAIFLRNCQQNHEAIVLSGKSMLKVHNLLLHYFMECIREPKAICAQAAIKDALQLCKTLSPQKDAEIGMSEEVQVVIKAAIELHPDFVLLGYKVGLITLITATDLLLILLQQAEKSGVFGTDAELLRSNEFSGLARAFRIGAVE
jgi:hypothetical protein